MEINPQNSRSFSYHLKPKTLLVCAVLSTLFGCGCVSQIGVLKGELYYVAHGFGVFALLTTVFFVYQALRVSRLRPCITFHESHFTAPYSPWLGNSIQVPYQEVSRVEIKYHEEKRAIAVYRRSGKTMKFAEDYMSQTNFEECWSLLDSLAGTISTLDATMTENRRVLCTVCRKAFDAAVSSEGKCPSCSGLAASDFKVLGFWSVIIGLLLLGLSALVGYLFSFVGVIFVWTGLLVAGVVLVLAGSHSIATGTKSPLFNLFLQPPTDRD